MLPRHNLPIKRVVTANAINLEPWEELVRVPLLEPWVVVYKHRLYVFEDKVNFERGCFYLDKHNINLI